MLGWGRGGGASDREGGFGGGPVTICCHRSETRCHPPGGSREPPPPSSAERCQHQHAVHTQHSPLLGVTTLSPRRSCGANGATPYDGCSAPPEQDRVADDNHALARRELNLRRTGHRLSATIYRSYANPRRSAHLHQELIQPLADVLTPLGDDVPPVIGCVVRVDRDRSHARERCGERLAARRSCNHTG